MSNLPTYVFVDSSFFKAAIDPKDEFHVQAKKTLSRLKGEKAILVTSNYILDESFTLIRVRCGLKIVDEFRKDLAASTQAIKIIRVTVTDESSAWKWFLNDWTGLSFTDCISFAIMKRLSIFRVATFDKHFSRAGFQPVI